MRRWDDGVIIGEILRRYYAQQDISYSGMSRENLSLLRAAVGHFGSWQAAIESAGLDYAEIRRYKVWTNERIIERIRELHHSGQDLSWRHVSQCLDPALAAAATSKRHFGCWQAALEQAGLDYEQIRRYQEWSPDKVLRRVHELYAQGQRLNAKRMEGEDIRLLTAARRRFPSWDLTLSAAGLNSRSIVVRGPYRRRKPSKHRA